MALKIGTLDLTNIRFGLAQVEKVYSGLDLVWEKVSLADSFAPLNWDLQQAAFFVMNTLFPTVASGYQNEEITGVTLSDDGTKLYIMYIEEEIANDSNFRHRINTYDLATPFQVDTAGAIVSTVTVPSPTVPFAERLSSLQIRNNGTKLYTSIFGGIEEYNLSTAYDISTISYVQSNTVSIDQGSTFFIDENGNNAYNTNFDVGSDQVSLVQYPMSTAYDISTLGSQSSRTITFGASFGDIVRNITIESGGGSAFVYNGNGEEVRRYTLSTPYDITSASFSPVETFGISTAGGLTPTIFFSNSGSDLYSLYPDTGLINQYRDRVIDPPVPQLVIQTTSTIGNWEANIQPSSNRTWVVSGDIPGYSTPNSVLNLASNTGTADISVNASDVTSVQLIDNEAPDISSLDLSELSLLTSLNIDGTTGITSLDISQNASLTFLGIAGTAITNIDISNNTQLEDVRVENSSLTPTALDQLIIELDNHGFSGRFVDPPGFTVNGQLIHTGVSRTSASDTAVANLLSKNWNIID